ncbi:MAG TPA: GFA family protein [Gaiellales bacterium]|nr:GFA family protein [Gaiellales bacterium]
MPAPRDRPAAASGSCLCGAIRFTLSAPPAHAGYCHCTRCQKRTGTAASAQARIDGRSFQMTSGEELLSVWRHPDGGFEKCFCSRCGSHLFSRSPDDHMQMSIRMGAFDGDPGVRPGWRTYVSYAAPWESIPDDGLERYPEGKGR